jgi:cold shock CspA family protein
MKRVSKREIGEKLRGRIISYNRRKGFGFIRTEHDSDILVSSYELGDLENEIVVGSTVEFTIGTYEEKTTATNIRILEKYKNDKKTYEMPNGVVIKVSDIVNFGISNALKDINSKLTKEGKEIVRNKDLEEHGYQRNSLDYIYIETKNDKFMFFDTSSPVTVDGKVNLDEYFKELNKEFRELGEESERPEENI